MSLSEDIKHGAAISGPLDNRFVQENSAGGIDACVLGCALLRVHGRNILQWTESEILHALYCAYDILSRSSPEQEGWTVFRELVYLNDHSSQSREDIADYVSSLEEMTYEIE